MIIAAVAAGGVAMRAMGQDADQAAATSTDPVAINAAATSTEETMGTTTASAATETDLQTATTTVPSSEPASTDEPTEPAPVVVEVPAGDPRIPQPVEVVRTPVRRTFLTEEGLEVIVLREGSGDRAVREGDVIKVTYEENVSGEYARLDPTRTGRDPFVFEVGSDKVIDGWNLGVIGMREYEIRKIFIPAPLAYGEKGEEGIGVPPNSNLELRISVIKIGQ